MDKPAKRLALRIGITIILIELVVLAVIGSIYADRFFRQIDQRLEDRVQLPARLINSSLIRLVALGDADSMRSLVGEEIVDSILIDFNGKVIFSLNPQYRNQTIDKIPSLNSAWLDKTNPQQTIQRLQEGSNRFLVSVAPIKDVLTGDNLYFAFTKTSIDAAEAEKSTVITLLLLGSLATVAATSIIIFLSFNITILRRIQIILRVLRRVESGELAARVPEMAHDEIGVLQHGVNSMAKRLEEIITTLEERVKERTEQFEQARLAAEHASNAKTVFLSNMSHELRTPLNTVIGYASSMLNIPEMYNGQALPPVFRHDVDLIRQNGQYLLGLINDSLDLSKIEAGKLSIYPQSVDLIDIFDGVLATSVGLIKEKPIQLKRDFHEKLDKVWADPVRIRQILLNLMSNAIKFTHSGSITLSAHKRDDRIEISVSDTGVGIAPEVLDKIFDRFEQAWAGLDRVYGGTGLGLDISQQLCRLHGTSLTVQSEPGKGSAFSFWLLLTDSVSSPTQPRSQLLDQDLLADSGADAINYDTMLSVLLVEGDSDMRHTLRRTLEDNNFIVFETHTSLEVEPMVTALMPDIIIWGVASPADESQALTVLRTIKETPETAMTPVIILAEQESAALKASGITAFIQKPVDGTVVLEKAREVVEASTKVENPLQ